MVIGIVAAVMAVSAGVAIAGGGLGSDTERQAFLNDAAKRLDVTPVELEAALQGAYEARIDAAVAAGKITKAQGDAMKQRSKDGGLPLFRGGRHGDDDGDRDGGPGDHGGFGHADGFGHSDGFGHHGAPLAGAATYLGLTAAELRTQLESGKTLAQIAKAQGKSVDGLEAKLKAELETKLDVAVKAGRITRAQADAMLARMAERLDDVIRGKLGAGRHRGSAWGGPPLGAPAPSAAFIPAGSPA